MDEDLRMAEDDKAEKDAINQDLRQKISGLEGSISKLVNSVHDDKENMVLRQS